MRSSLLLILLLLSQVCAAQNTLMVNFTHDGLTVNARLQLPAGNGKFPVIVINPGTGPNDKDGTAPMIGANAACLYPGLLGDTLRPYRGLSQALSDSGYAVLTYDKIEYTYPMVSPITFHKLWLPVESAVAYLKTRNDIDTTQIVLLGHSEGSTMIPYIARNTTGIKALISLAGPRRPIDTLLAYQLVYIAQTCNGDVSMATAQGNQILQYFNLVRNGNYNSSTPALFGVNPDVWEEYMYVADSVVINYVSANKPTLFIGLENDFNVPVSTELSRFQNEITIPADYYSIAGLNHFLTTANDPAVSETLTDTIIYWLRAKDIVPTSVGQIPSHADDINVTVKDGKILEITSYDEIVNVRVIDMQGKLLLEQKLNNRKGNISLNDSVSGVYIVEVTTRHLKKSFKISAI